MPSVRDKLNSRTLFGDARGDGEVALVEFCGTFLFLLVGLGGIQAAHYIDTIRGQASESPDIQQLLFQSASLSFALLVCVWLFYRVTGGIFNPAVSTALLLIGQIGFLRWVLCCIAQLAGGIAASAVLLALLPGPLKVNTKPGASVNKAQAVFIEMFLTSALVLSVLMLAAEKHRSTAFAPIGIGITLFAAMLWGTLYTGASLNTARSFGPSVVTGFDSSHWVYWLGPFLGSLLAVAFYTILKRINYWTLNPGQEADDPRESPEDPVKRAEDAEHQEANKTRKP